MQLQEKQVFLLVESTIEEPLYSIDDLYGLVGDNLKKTYDIRQV